ncbi:MAG: hypothetical protein QNJ12_14245 [Ilumatobacter sp.]|uniref:hypothetical protein n=1 Tax=Ilumatobacter sp. TaxID=1967498 RepID=UPI0026096C4F|nr:hypothetical protein [Ilumatobacter sp.]MDJ0769957.1 hypothetical protein [Ilumatobacter sp.]
MAWLTPVVVVAFIAAALLAARYGAQRERKRRLAAQARARSLGYEMDLDDGKPPQLGMALFELGRSQRVSYRTWRHDSPDSVFQYQYVTGSGDDQKTHRRTAVLVHVPFDAPHLRIELEGFWSTVGRAVGIRDIEIESEAFNDRYRVRSDDERFAITLLDHEMIAWMLSPHSGGGEVRFEFAGRWMLCWGDRIDDEHLIPLLQWAQHARLNLPEVLTSLYPPT